MTDISTNSTTTHLKARIEAILFVAASPVTVGQIAETLDVSSKEVENTLLELRSDMEAGRGLTLQEHGGKYQLTSRSDFSLDIERFLGLEASAKLTRASVETLAIIAYKQPITRPGIDAIRGVSSDGVIKSLLAKGLIQEVGRAEGPGRPILFSTTADFLQHFGLHSIDQLPPFEEMEISPDVPGSGILKD